jgi:hypothetical protein
VVAFQTEPAAPAPFAQRVRAQAGSGKRNGDAFYKWQSWSSGRLGSASGTLSLSQFKADGFRQNSAAEIRQLNAGVDYVFSGGTLATLRFSAADNPKAGTRALTWADLVTRTRRPRTISGANRDVKRAARARRAASALSSEFDVSIFGLLRDWRARSPSPPRRSCRTSAPRNARSHGRVRVTYPPLGDLAAPRVSLGADLQRMRDDRQTSAVATTKPTILIN